VRILSALSLLLFFPPIFSAQEHVGQYSQADIDRGARLYGTNCALCHGPAGDSVATVNLRSGRFRHAASDEELGRVIVAGIPGTAMPPHKFEPPDVSGLVAYIRSLRDQRAVAVAGGDAGRGRALFAGKGGCPACHRVNGQGSRFAPDLSEIGSVRQPAALLRSLVDPTATMLPINRPVRAVTRDGKTIAGRRLNEDTYSVQLIDTEDRLVALIKADLKEYVVSKVSSMPSYRDKLTPQELADIVAYLGTLKGLP
jgi:putative heme-binding domain-containing protein